MLTELDKKVIILKIILISLILLNIKHFIIQAYYIQRKFLCKIYRKQPKMHSIARNATFCYIRWISLIHLKPAVMIKSVWIAISLLASLLGKVFEYFAVRWRISKDCPNKNIRAPNFVPDDFAATKIVYRESEVVESLICFE